MKSRLLAERRRWRTGLLVTGWTDSLKYTRQQLSCTIKIKSTRYDERLVTSAGPSAPEGHDRVVTHQVWPEQRIRIWIRKTNNTKQDNVSYQLSHVWDEVLTDVRNCSQSWWRPRLKDQNVNKQYAFWFLAGKLSWDVTTTQVNSALHPSAVAKSSTSFGCGKGGKVTVARWQVTLCDPICHVISRNGEVISTNCYIRFTVQTSCGPQFYYWKNISSHLIGIFLLMCKTSKKRHSPKTKT